MARVNWQRVEQAFAGLNHGRLIGEVVRGLDSDNDKRVYDAIVRLWCFARDNDQLEITGSVMLPVGRIADAARSGGDRLDEDEVRVSVSHLSQAVVRGQAQVGNRVYGFERPLLCLTARGVGEHRHLLFLFPAAFALAHESAA